MKDRKQITKLGRLDLLKLGRIDSFCLQRNSADPDVLTMTVDVLYRPDNEKLQISFINVRKILFPEQVDTCLYFSELEIEDVHDHQIENTGYYVKDYGVTGLSLFCEAIEVTYRDGSHYRLD